MKYFFVFIAFIGLSNSVLKAQSKGVLTDADKSALEGIIVETYYISDSTDYKDTVGGRLPQSSVTYRIYVDMKFDYSLQAVYGVAGHELRMATTTEFFNNKDRGDKTGCFIDSRKINENTLALDSWLTMNGATKYHAGILRADDKDGSIINKKKLTGADGLVIGNVPAVIYFGLDVDPFYHQNNVSVFSSTDGSYAVFGGIKGPTDDNRVLIAQLTTNGKLSFELNLQIGTPTGGVVNFVAKNPEGLEIQFDGLVYPAPNMINIKGGKK